MEIRRFSGEMGAVNEAFWVNESARPAQITGTARRFTEESDDPERAKVSVEDSAHETLRWGFSTGSLATLTIVRSDIPSGQPISGDTQAAPVVDIAPGFTVRVSIGFLNDPVTIRLGAERGGTPVDFRADVEGDGSSAAAAIDVANEGDTPLTVTATGTRRNREGAEEPLVNTGFQQREFEAFGGMGGTRRNFDAPYRYCAVLVSAPLG
jgi:hypothetical protein